MSATLLPADGLLLGRAKVPGFAYPRVVTVRGGKVLDITAKAAPTVRDATRKSEVLRTTRTPSEPITADATATRPMAKSAIRPVVVTCTTMSTGRLHYHIGRGAPRTASRGAAGDRPATNLVRPDGHRSGPACTSPGRTEITAVATVAMSPGTPRTP